MRSVRRSATASLGLLGIAIIATSGLARVSENVHATSSSTEAPQIRQVAVVSPRDQDTRANLQWVFGNEVNAKQRDLEYAKQADREGYPAVARLFRACARAEEAHGEQHVHAIAWTGGEARAVLERVWTGTTEQNLRGSLSFEIYEATQVYPSVVERARADHQAMAVRSANYALSAEREHAGLMAAALATLEQRPAPTPIFVCPSCGKTVTAVDFAKCPNCFTAAKRFVAVS